MRIDRNVSVQVGGCVLFAALAIPLFVFGQSRDTSETKDHGYHGPQAHHPNAGVDQQAVDLEALGLPAAHKGDRKRPRFFSRWRNILVAGAHRLCDLQADIMGDNAGNGYADDAGADDPDDGGWDWEIAPGAARHSPNPSPENTYGVTALGLTPAYWVGLKNPRFFIGMLDAYLGIEGRSEIDSAPDFVYLALLGFLFKDRGFVELARNRYDKKVASYGGSLLLARHIRNVRGDAGLEGLIPFDLGWFVWAASLLDLAFPGQGYFSHAQTYGQVIADDIHDPAGYFDIHDPQGSYYVLGIACAIHAMKLSRVDLPLIPTLKQKLYDHQRPDGAWPFNADYPAGDYQSTAYAVQKLSFVCARDPRARAAARAGSNWLAVRQLPTGGWEHLPGIENTEVNAEILHALFRVPPRIRLKKRDGMRMEKSFERSRARHPIARPLCL